MTSFARARSLAVSLLVLLACCAAAAQDAEPLTLEVALARAGEHAQAVESARSALADAQRALETAAVDPATTRLAQASAARAVAAAEGDLKVATAAVNHEVVSAYAEVLEAQAAKALARKRLEILTVTLQATRARFEAGAVTAAEVTTAERDVANQERALEEAESRLAFARDALETLIGIEPVSLAPITVDDLLEADELELLVTEVLERSARVAGARRAVEAAEAQLAATDNALSSRMEIEAARRGVANAVDALANAVVSVQRDVQRSRSAGTATENRYRGARDAAAAASAALAAQRARLGAGTISALAFAQAEFALEAALADEAGALHALVAAQYALRAASVR